MVYRIGIDVGGTNTDAAVLGDGKAVIGCAKAPTSPDVLSGIKESISRVLVGTRIGKSIIDKPGIRHCCSPEFPMTRFPGSYRMFVKFVKPQFVFCMNRSWQYHTLLLGNHTLHQCCGEAQGAGPSVSPAPLWACHSGAASIL